MIEVSELNAVLRDCLYTPEEAPSDGPVPAEAVLVEGVVRKFGFHPQRLETHRAEVRAWLAQLPHQFREDEGGGWSFLNACLLDDGTQWTGLHADMEALLALGMGLGLVKCQMPRELWGALPGGMPYYAIKREAANDG